MKINVNLTSRKSHMPIDQIKIPGHFNRPSTKKMLLHMERYLNGITLDPVITDEDNILLDGYISLLIAQAAGMEAITVYKVVARA